MASSRDRQRKLARAKLDRQMARRAAAARRRRQIQAGVGAALALLLIVLGSVWALGGFDSDPESAAAPEICSWTPQDATANSNLKDVDRPPTTGLPTSGTRPMTITTNQGAPITVALNLTDAPCAGASFAHLAGRNFFDNTKCHEITSEGALLCGDPSGTGQGGPTYSFFNENVPSAPEPTPAASPAAKQPPRYPAGTVAATGTAPGANGSQFLIFFKDANPADATYSIIGTVSSGLDVVRKIGAMETVDNGAGQKVKPKTDVLIQSLTVGEVTTEPAPAPSATATPSGSPSTAG
ncbi:peptidyl-prolyl cis-trans isomerase B (cyclophilin B) [Micromonospora pattaloongensis]|uniref:Peptidyl-prolyl cis-trans isomerase B (Cyclophilin B) n=1 Tax=Micromonospora pattaloongensis TaxID=405436 RepID=A0A1H3S739_9ACTN|nr:peptidylprolyl isomerase [Micromonospora pattaloongensis]SDZ32969.1 peptidyl-prolyl cis-trans isomerase B (cyclophilin B) [Micromonospora pattaloongensis]